MINITKFTLLIAVLLLASCGGGGGGSAVPPVVGYVVDSPVEGLSYTCGALTGTTGSDGSFLHDSGAACTFKIGNVTIGAFNSAPTDGVITPHDLAGVSRGDSLNTSAVAIAQFLQSLDDGSGIGKIKIPSSVVTALSSVPAQKIVDGTTTLTQSTLTNLVSTATGSTKTLVSAATAGAAMNSYIQTKYPDLDVSKGSATSSGSSSSSSSSTSFSAPSLTASPPKSLTAVLNTVGLTATTDIAAVGYYVVLPATASAPNKWQIVAGTDSSNNAASLSGSFNLSASTAATQTISGLSFSSDYKVYFVAANASQTSKMTEVATSTVSIGAEPRAPNLSNNAGEVINSLDTKITFNVSSDVASVAYWVVLPTSATAPSASNIIAAQDANNSPVNINGNTSLTAATSQPITITGLNYGASYKVYLVARNQADINKISQVYSILMATRSQYLYLIDEQKTGAILVYKIESNGDLTYVSKTSSGDNSESEIVFTPDGKYAFVSNTYSSAFSQFKLESNGSLTALDNPTVKLNGLPSSIAIENNSKSIFARIDRQGLDNIPFRNLVQYSIRSNGQINPTGTTLLDFSAYSDPNNCELKGVVIEPIGNNLYVTCRIFSQDIKYYISYIYQFKIDANGNATPLLPARIKVDNFKVDVNSIVTSADGKYLYLLNPDDGSIAQFSIDSSGKLSSLMPSLIAGSNAVVIRSFPIMAPNGNEFYSLNRSRLTVNTDGTLAKNTLSMVSGVDAAFNSTGQFLYTTTGDVNGKTAIRIFTSTMSSSSNTFDLFKTINTDVNISSDLVVRRQIKIN